MYVATRRATIGARPIIDLAQWTHGLDLSEDVLETLVLQDMREAVVDMVFLSNVSVMLLGWGPCWTTFADALHALQDIYSYKKEHAAHAAQHNIITVAMQDPASGIAPGDLQGSMDYAGAQFAAAFARFEQCTRLLSTFGQSDSKLRRKVDQYAACLMDLVLGNIEWSLVSRRYFVFEDEESRQKGIVRLSSGISTTSQQPYIASFVSSLVEGIRRWAGALKMVKPFHIL